MSEKPTYQELERRVRKLEGAESGSHIAEIVQRNLEVFFNPIFEKHNAVMLLIEPTSGVIINANIAAQNYYGYSTSTLKQMKIEDINTLSPDEVAEKRLEAANEKNNYFEFPHRLSSGEIRMVEVHSSPIMINDKKYLLSVIHDITERKKAEQELIESKQKYQSMVENIGIGVSLLNKNMEIIELNKQMREWFPDVDLTTKPICYKVLNAPPKDSICDWCPTYKTLQDGMTHESISKTPKAGGVRNYRIISSPVIDSNGEIKAAIEMVEDITDQLKFEEQMQKAQRIESIGNLAGGIAHDFNNILFPIIGMAEMLLEDLPPGSGERENAEEIYKAGKRGSDLVKQILSFSRQSEHKMMPTRIQNVLNEVIKLSRSTLPAYIEISQDIQTDCGMVLADPSQIHQIGMNIITNAYHALENTGGKISVILRHSVLEAPESPQINLPPGHYAVISISDTGHGMSEELIGKIFDPYFTTKKQGKGTGLGLAVVYGIVEEHKGAIKVYSEIGNGSTFDIYLPLMKKHNGIESIPEAEPYKGGNERILLVEDEEPIVKLEKQMLERMGYTVTSRLHSVEALEAFRANPSSFDLVVTDMSMPNIAGDELARTIKAIRSDVPIIICTGFSERIQEDNIKQMGIDGLLMKPIVKSELANTVRKVLDEAKSENQGFVSES